jgi:pantetheine-phosphate adenylyltransferase
MKERIAIVPGSFDPITKGHIDIINRAAELYDKVYVAVMINAQKEYLFTLSQREDIARACFLGNEKVTVISSDGWLWELARDLGACAIVKGDRNEIDLAYEKGMAEFNSKHCPQAKTVLLKAEDGLANVSSTVVRERLAAREAIDDIVSKEALEVILKII